MISGAAGSVWARTPVAWKTALAMAGAGGTRPISPTPFTPYGPLTFGNLQDDALDLRRHVLGSGQQIFGEAVHSLPIGLQAHVLVERVPMPMATAPSIVVGVFVVGAER